MVPPASAAEDRAKNRMDSEARCSLRIFESLNNGKKCRAQHKQPARPVVCSTSHSCARASLIFVLLFSANGFTAELDGLASRAEVTGPRGNFVTEMVSLADGTARFVQIYPPNDPKGRSRVELIVTGGKVAFQRDAKGTFVPADAGTERFRARSRCGAPGTRQRVAARSPVAARTRGDGRRHRDHRALPSTASTSAWSCRSQRRSRTPLRPRIVLSIDTPSCCRSGSHRALPRPAA